MNTPRRPPECRAEEEPVQLITACPKPIGHRWRSAQAVRAAKREMRVGASGRWANQAARRSRLRAAAVATVCRPVLASLLQARLGQPSAGLSWPAHGSAPGAGQTRARLARAYSRSLDAEQKAGGRLRSPSGPERPRAPRVRGAAVTQASG